MTNHIVDVPARKAAKVAGFGYLIIGILGIFANFFVLENLIVWDDAGATAENIAGSEGLFRSGIVALLIVAALDVVIALALYVLLRPVNRTIALLAAWFRLAYAIIFGVAIVNLVVALEVLGDADYLTALDPGQAHAQAMLFLNAFRYGWLIGLVLFGVHLAGLGYLIIRSSYVPRILGVLLMVAAAGYAIDGLANVLLSNYADYETIFLIIVATPSIIGELSLTFWLLFKGGKVELAGEKDSMPSRT